MVVRVELIGGEYVKSTCQLRIRNEDGSQWQSGGTFNMKRGSVRRFVERELGHGVMLSRGFTSVLWQARTLCVDFDDRITDKLQFARTIPV
jgi:hypothetical protein